MNKLLNSITRLFSLRLFLNLLLCGVLTMMIFNSNIPKTNVVEINLCKSFSVVSILLFTYANNLFLVPRYLARQRWLIYGPLVLLLILSYSFLYSVFVNAVLQYYPTIKYYEIVLFTVSMEKGWSIEALVSSTTSYAFIFGVWLLAMTMAWYMHDHARQRKAMLLAQQKQTETELSFLKAQINPHFLFNTLNNLYALARRKSDNAPDAILKLSAILRYLLYDSNTPTVPFEKEKEVMQAYIDIELLRLDNKNQLTFNISADKDYQVPPLLWLPVLENLFKHGTRTVSDDNEVEYRFEIKDNLLSIYSKNKEKMLTTAKEEQGGIGLSNLEKRLEILYPGKYNMSAAQQNNCYISEVNIQLA